MIKKVLMLILALFLLGQGVLWAAEPIKVAVFPFDVFSRQPLNRLKTDLQDMLKTRLAKDGVNVLTPAEVNEALEKEGKPLDLTVARRVAGSLGADFAVYGSVTKIGNRVSLDVKILDVLGMIRPQSVFVEGAGISSLPSLTDRLSREVATKVSGREKVAEVKIEGNKRIEDDAVKAIIKTKPGGPFSPLLLDEDLRAIWKMGYFENVRVKTNDLPTGKEVVFEVTEKPMLREIRFTGNDVFDNKDIQDQIGLKPFSVIKPGFIKEAEAKIVKMYHDKGYYDVKVTANMLDLPSGERGVHFKITEGDKVFIETITFNGNKAFDADTLRDQMTTKEEGWFSWLTDDNLLDRAKIDQDREKLTDFYYNNGYLNARIGEPDVTREKGGLNVAFNIVEGPRYKVGAVQVTGEMIIPQADVMKGLKINAGDWFNRSNLRADLAFLHDLYADKGYAYVEARPRVREDREKKQVNITYNVKKGRKVWFERIVITGNDRTRDRVIRRELSVVEGDLFSSRALRNSNMRLRKLNFFEDVHISTKQGTSPDKMDLKVNVKEKRTGQFNVGAGYSTVDKLMFMGSITEANLFGRGQRLELKGSLGGKSTRYTLSFTEPWLFDRPISAGADIYDWRREYTSYDKESIGGRIRFGFPTPFNATRFYAYYKYEDATVSNVSENSATIIKDQEGNHITSSVKFIIRRDTRNHSFNTTHGSDNSLGVEYAGGFLGGTNSFVKATAESGWYFPLFWDTVFVTHGKLGWVTSHGDGTLPIYERFFLGGINTLRGFDYLSVGPKDPATGDVIGGERMALLNLEFRFPLVKKAGLVGLLFYDTGNSWTQDDGYEFSDLRSSVGGGIRWFSPIGPLRLEYGYVLDPEPGEADSNWEFTIGSMF
jgi:outer membrane protein insertion porin family